MTKVYSILTSLAMLLLVSCGTQPGNKDSHKKTVRQTITANFNADSAYAYTAKQVALLYKNRWLIELFFK